MTVCRYVCLGSINFPNKKHTKTHIHAHIHTQVQNHDRFDKDEGTLICTMSVPPSGEGSINFPKTKSILKHTYMHTYTHKHINT
jgi:hypothetical protein